MREKTKKELEMLVRDMVEEVLREKKLTGSGGMGLFGMYDFWRSDVKENAYVEGVVSKVDRIETLVEKIRERTNIDDYEYVEEKKLKKKTPRAKTATEAILEDE